MVGHQRESHYLGGLESTAKKKIESYRYTAESCKWIWQASFLPCDSKGIEV